MKICNAFSLNIQPITTKFCTHHNSNTVWSVEHILNQSNAYFYQISNSIKILLVGWAPGLGSRIMPKAAATEHKVNLLNGLSDCKCAETAQPTRQENSWDSTSVIKIYQVCEQHDDCNHQSLDESAQWFVCKCAKTSKVSQTERRTNEQTDIRRRSFLGPPPTPLRVTIIDYKNALIK